MDLETFQRLKDKLNINRDTKTSSQQSPPPPLSFAPFGVREVKPLIGNSVIKAASNIR